MIVNSRLTRLLLAGFLLHFAAGAAWADDKPPAKEKQAAQPPADPLTPEAEKVADDLKKKLPADSEARQMLDDILSGSRLGPTDGWFKSAVAQTRFPWDYVRKRYDTDQDGKATLKEFGGAEADFARLDRDGDGAITGKDLEWKDHALARTAGAMLFYQADRDGDGRVSPEEWRKVYEGLGGEDESFLSLDDLVTQLQPPEDRPRPRGKHPSASTLVLALARQELGSLEPGPALGDKAPDFTLRTVDGKQEVTLSREIGRQPVVLVMGNFTCGPFRSQAGNIEKLYQRHKDRARFLMVYVREAHPSDGWWSEGNRKIGIHLPQPTSDDERLGVAQKCQKHLGFDMPFLVDGISDRVGTVYSGMPSRLYLIDGAGRVAYKSGRGPFGFKPGELEQALILLLCAGKN